MTLPEEENFLRIVYLLYRVVTPSLTRFFDGKHHNLSAVLNLATNKTILFNLYKPPKGFQRVLYAHQWNTLYPPIGSPPVVSNDLDLTLMVCLLRNIPPVVGAPVPNGFDQLPLSIDISDGANIARIKHYKNFLVSHSTDGKLFSKDFSKIWTELETAIKGLGNAQDVADANLAKSKILDGSMKTLLSTQLELEAKVSYLQDQMEIEKCAKVIIQTQIKRIEEQIITNELKTNQQIDENKNTTSSCLREMQDKDKKELSRINTSIANLEEQQTTLNSFQVVVLDKFNKLDMLVSENERVIDDLKGQVESICIEIKSYISKVNSMIELLEKKSCNVDQLLEDVKCCGTKQDIRELRVEIGQLKSDQKKVPDWMIETLERWKKEDEYFVDTRASRYVIDCIHKHVCVTVVGPSGVGKTFILQHVALEMEREGYTIIKVNSPEEIKENFMSDRPTLFVMDDLCGNLTATTYRLDVWKRSLKDITTILETNVSKLMFTCRLQVFQDEGFKHSDFHLLKTCTCNLVAKKLVLTDSEKESMLLKYLGNVNSKGLERLYQYDFFPLLCKLLTTIIDKSNFCMETFLEDPFSIFENEFNDLFVDCKEGRYKIIALLVLVIYNNQLDTTALTGKDDKFKQTLDDILEECCINEFVKFKSLIKELDTLTGTFVWNEDGVYSTIHHKLFDFLAYYFGRKNEVTQTDFIELLIRHANEGFIEKRFVIKERGQPDDTKCKQYAITIEDDNLQVYTERVFSEMTKGDHGMECLTSNRNRHNKTFHNYLHTLITNLSSIDIKELIKCANTNFVQLMFVMGKDDIKHYTPHTHKRYGIVISEDVTKVYIKRVFDDITMTNDVNKHINGNRNKNNIIFQAKLLHYIKHFDGSKISHLIEHASQDFIDRLCVLTKDDTMDSFEYEFERFGLFIPEFCIQSYMTRWFSGLTKTSDIERYFANNRNRHTNIFQTSLLAYMERIDDKIENLIQTASNDFLHKLFVTTKNDIQNKSVKEYERYGIILKDNNLAIYTDKILSSIEKYESFVNDIKCNRTLKHVLSCLSQYSLLKITELINTANNTIFHRMIAVDIESKLRLGKTYSNRQYVVRDDLDMFKITEGPIKCPVDLGSAYMDRMVSDWGKGNFYAVINNKNLKNRSFVKSFLAHLKLLAPSKQSNLVHIAQDGWNHTAFTICCNHGNVIFAQWCLEILLHENPEQEQYKLCSLFLLVVFNNQLEENLNNDDSAKVNSMIFSFRKKNNIREGISFSDVKEVIDASLNIINFTKKYKGVYSVKHDNVFLWLVFYFASIRQMSKILVEFADERVLYIMLQIEMYASDKKYSILHIPNEELQTCMNRVFKKMTNSVEFCEYIHENDKKTNVSSVASFLRKLNENDINTILENSCIGLINKLFVMDTNIPKNNRNEEWQFFIVIPDDSQFTYIKRFLDHLANNDCVEACLQENRNKKTEVFQTRLLFYMTEMNINEVKKLIDQASSDFINRLFVISEDDIKPESCWEYERYGIVVPKDLLHIYIQRVFIDMSKSAYLPVNRNSANTEFRSSLNSYINLLDEDELTSLIHTASSKFIRRIFLSTEEELINIDLDTQRYENYNMCIPKKYFRPGFESCSITSTRFTDSTRKTFKSTLTKDDSSTFIIITNNDINCEDFMITVKRRKNFDNSQCLLSKYIDPMCTGKIMVMKFPKLLVEKYIQRMLADWMKGSVHDVLRNINLSIQSFRTYFIAHLNNIEKSTRVKLTEVTDYHTGDSALAVSCRAGIIELVEWFIVNNVSINSFNKYEEHPLNIACAQNRSDIVYSLLHSNNEVDVNIAISEYGNPPLYEACENGNREIVSLLLKKNANVNYYSSIPMERETSLFVACKYGHLEIVSLLLHNKSTRIFINVGDILNYITPLYIACKRGHTEIVSLLLEHNANHIDINISGERNKTPLYIACQRRHIKIVSLLLNYYADEVDMYKATNKNKTPLYAACKGGYADIVLLLLAREIGVINKCKIDEASPLWVACRGGHVKVVSTLLNQTGIYIDKCMLIGISPLCIASLLGHTEIVKTLLEKKADTDICVKNKEIVMQVFEKYRSKHRGTKTLVYEKCIKYIRKLVSENASEHVKSYIYGMEEDWVFKAILGSSPLHMASLMGHYEIVRLLVESNSCINCLSENGNTPLFLACELGHENIVHVLLANGADPTLDKKDRTPLTIARDNKHMQIVEIIESQTIK